MCRKNKKNQNAVNKLLVRDARWSALKQIPQMKYRFSQTTVTLTQGVISVGLFVEIIINVVIYLWSIFDFLTRKDSRQKETSHKRMSNNSSQ